MILNNGGYQGGVCRPQKSANTAINICFPRRAGCYKSTSMLLARTHACKRPWGVLNNSYKYKGILRPKSLRSTTLEKPLHMCTRKYVQRVRVAAPFITAKRKKKPGNNPIIHQLEWITKLFSLPRLRCCTAVGINEPEARAMTSNIMLKLKRESPSSLN